MPIAYECAGEYRQHEDRRYVAGDQLSFFPVFGTGNVFVGFQHNSITLPADGFRGAYINAFATADAFRISDISDVQLACIDAKPTVDTFGGIDLDSE